MSSWQLQAAKARLSELVRSAQEAGPQKITLHGAVAVVVLSRREYERLAGRKRSLPELLRGSPLHAVELTAPRRQGTTARGGHR